MGGWVKRHIVVDTLGSIGLKADVAAGDLALVPPVGDGAVDSEGHILALAGDFEGVPLAHGRYAWTGR
jgi:hypothetical protein